MRASLVLFGAFIAVQVLTSCATPTMVKSTSNNISLFQKLRQIAIPGFTDTLPGIFGAPDDTDTNNNDSPGPAPSPSGVPPPPPLAADPDPGLPPIPTPDPGLPPIPTPPQQPPPALLPPQPTDQPTPLPAQPIEQPTPTPLQPTEQPLPVSSPVQQMPGVLEMMPFPTPVAPMLPPDSTDESGMGIGGPTPMPISTGLPGNIPDGMPPNSGLPTMPNNPAAQASPIQGNIPPNPPVLNLANFLNPLNLFNLLPNPAAFFPNPVNFLVNAINTMPNTANPFPAFNFNFPIPTGRPEPAGDGTAAACSVVLLRDTLSCACFLAFQVGMPPEFQPITLIRGACEANFGPVELLDSSCEDLATNGQFILEQAPVMVAQTLFNCFNPFTPLRLPNGN